MKVVILAGGKGSRLSEYTKKIPKPMVRIKGIPIIVHIMKIYAKFGYKDFIIAAGFKSKIIKNYFKKILDWKIEVIDTGLNSMTGGRVRRLKSILKSEKFFLTYGDGIANINLKKLLKFHIKCKSTVTLTAVRPPARFGAITIKGKVSIFREKSVLDQGWINGGFFVVEPTIFRYLKNDQVILEKLPFDKIRKERKLYAYKHKSLWYCMDTIRDKEILEKIEIYSLGLIDEQN